MKNQIEWPMKIKSIFFYKQTVTGTLLFLLVVFGIDSFFQKLPLSGYGLIFIILLLITMTTYATCQGIKWTITSNKPLYFCIKKRNQNENFVKLFMKCDNELFNKAKNFCKDYFSCFKCKTHLDEEIRLLLKDIERDFIKTWYLGISQDPSFLFESHSILEEFFDKIIKKVKNFNHKNLICSILILYLNNLQEYKKSIKKITRMNSENNSKTNVELSDVHKFIHPGSQNEQILNHYFKKISKVILKEFLPSEFTNSLECKILGGIIGKKILRKLLVTLEDPTWINIKLIYLLNVQKYEELMKGRTYTVKDKTEKSEANESLSEKPTLLRRKRYVPCNLFETNKTLFERNGFCGNIPPKIEDGFSQLNPIEKESLNLPLPSYKIEENKGNISTVLSGLISSTAGPLLPDNISVHYKALNKMWQSPVAEVKDISESITNSFRKVFVVNGIKHKSLGRSKSTESLTLLAESGLKTKDVSIGEELCESAVVNAKNECAGTIPAVKGFKKLTKTYSFDDESLSLENKPVVEEVSAEPEAQEAIVSNPDYQRDVSPVYEEPQDFATTIAKLRCLLQQRESTSTLSDKSNPSVDSQSTDKSHSSNKSQSLEEDSFDSRITSELPNDGRLFLNICIPKGELVTEAGSTHVLYTIQYDGVYLLKDEQNVEPGLVLQTMVVKRRFQDFLKLQIKLEQNGELRSFMKGVNGPAKWLSQASGIQPEESFSRKATLETFLRQICSKVELSNSPCVHEFLAYGQTGNDALIKKGFEPSLQRFDKLLANKVSGVFNSIRTALPSFDFDSPTFIATGDAVKGVQEQRLLQGFLNFGNKPEEYEINLNFVAKEHTGESLVDDIRRFFNRKSDYIEDAVEALNSNDWLIEGNECRLFLAEGTCVWEDHKDVLLDDELEPLDSAMPVYSLVIDILSELLQDSDCWIVKEPVVRLLKVVSGHWESKLVEEMSEWDWNRIAGNAIRLLRTAVFQSVPRETVTLTAEETKEVLKNVILDLTPDWVTEFIKPEGLSSAVSLFIDSFQHFKLNRDVLLRFFDILLVRFLSCHHLSYNCSEMNDRKTVNQNYEKEGK